MAKKTKRKGFDKEAFVEALNMMNPQGEPILPEDFEEVCSEVMQSMSELEAAKYSALNFLMENGVTPDEYSRCYKAYEMTMDLMPEKQKNEFMLEPQLYRHCDKVEAYTPLSNSADHTLVLKIQMKDVSKPPMWREVEVPGDSNFLQLHEIIQTLMGFYDCHLWQFNKKAYDNSLEISPDTDYDDNFFSMRNPRLDPEETPLSMFLQKKGDKLEYVYDFGDDWIFTVEVKDLLKKHSDHPVCIKFKGDLNPIEDFGGVWSYLDARDYLTQWTTISKKTARKLASDLGFDSPDEFYDFLLDHTFHIDYVNALLSEI